MTSNEPLVSIAIPFAAVPLQHLEGAIRSVFAQSYGNWELTLIPDGEFPEVEDHLRQITDPRVTLLAGGPNRGLAARLNQAADLARGSMMVRMDADDVMHPNRVRTSVEALGAGLDVVGTRAFLIDGSTAIRGAFKEPPLPVDEVGYLRSNAFSHPTVAGQTEWFRRHRYDERMQRSEDKELWLRTAGMSRFLKVDSRLMFYRVADLSRTKQRRDSVHDRRILRTYGPRFVGVSGTTKLLLRSWTKQQLFAAATLALSADRLLSSKFTPCSLAERTAAEAALERALSAHVDGWDEVARSVLPRSQHE